MKYLFYGDLLGIASAYRLGANVAYGKLNDFYNTSFSTLKALQEADLGCKVEMFSDSIFISGSDAVQAIKTIGLLYSDLLRKNLFLRGAIVKGELKYEVRTTREQFEKRLPENDTLAKAAGLEKAVKGARFIIENFVAQELFESIPEWMTHEGYAQNVALDHDNENLLRKICPTPDGSGYECLYYWANGFDDKEFRRKIADLKHLKEMKDDSLKPHYDETINLVKRCATRKRISHPSKATGEF